MVSLDDAEQFVDGVSVRWSRIGEIAVVSLILTWLSGVADFLFRAITEPATIVRASSAWFVAVVEAAIGIGQAAVRGGFAGAAGAIRTTELGPAGFAVGVLLIVVFVWLLYQTTDWLEVGA